MSGVERKPGESDLDFHKRIIYGKLVDKTLADFDYGELSVLAYGKEYSADVARRLFYGSRYTLDMLGADMRGAIGDEGVLRETDNALLDLAKERRRLYDQRRENSKLVTEMARFEHLSDKLSESAARLNEELPLCRDEFAEIAAAGGDEAVIVLSDWHYGMVDDNIWNTYNTDVCRDRLRRFANAADARLSRHNISKLHIILLGDFAHGAANVSCRVASEELVCDQLMHAAEMIAELVSFLADKVEHTNVYSTYGNHMRTTPNKKEGIHADNMERIIPWWIRERLSAREDVTVVPSEFHEFVKLRIKGYGIVAIHGDLDNVRSSGLQINTLFNKRYGENVDYIIYGDKHHIEEYESTGIENILVRSLCGTDDYANSKRLYSAPGQTIIMFDENGRDATYHINLS